MGKNYLAFEVPGSDVAERIFTYATEQGATAVLTTDPNLAKKWRTSLIERTGPASGRNKQPRPDRALLAGVSQPPIEHGTAEENGPSLPKKTQMVLDQLEPPAEAVDAVDEPLGGGDVNMEKADEESQGPSGNKTPPVQQKRRGRPPRSTRSKQLVASTPDVVEAGEQGPSEGESPAVGAKRRGRPPGSKGKKNKSEGAARRSPSAPDVVEAGEQGTSGGGAPAVGAKKCWRKRKLPVEPQANLLPYDLTFDTEPLRLSLRALAVQLDRGFDVVQPQPKRRTPVKVASASPIVNDVTSCIVNDVTPKNVGDVTQPKALPVIGGLAANLEDIVLPPIPTQPFEEVPGNVVSKPFVQTMLQDPAIPRNEVQLSTPGSVRVKQEPGCVQVKKEPMHWPIVRVKAEPVDEEHSVAEDVLDGIIFRIINDTTSETIRVKKELIENYEEQATAENPLEDMNLVEGPIAIVLPSAIRAPVAGNLSGIPEGHGVNVEQALLPKTEILPMEQALPVDSASQIVNDVTSGIFNDVTPKNVGDVTQPRALPVIGGLAANLEDIVLPPIPTQPG